MQALPMDTSNEYWSVMENVWSILDLKGRETMLKKLTKGPEDLTREMTSFLTSLSKSENSKDSASLGPNILSRIWGALNDE